MQNTRQGLPAWDVRDLQNRFDCSAPGTGCDMAWQVLLMASSALIDAVNKQLDDVATAAATVVAAVAAAAAPIGIMAAGC